MGIFSLTAQILDRAEAVEVLRASIVWLRGLPESTVFLAQEELHRFRAGGTPKSLPLCKGVRGNYLAYAPLTLAAGAARTWDLVADVGRDHQQVAWIRKQLIEDMPIEEALADSMAEDHVDLLRNVAGADGLQATGSQLATAHHHANVLFNNMRGGVFAANYSVETRDFCDFIAARNHVVTNSAQAFLRGLPDQIEYDELLNRAREKRDADLLRLTLEYLPLTFGRRHGDPSRPWNMFEIHVRNDDGSNIYNYQGNWRDIFQNWEALGVSFPAFLPSFVAKFVNASTIDGFNPYRITRDGIDWEAPDPEDPWSNIGYWGDHQIIYLSKLLETVRDYYPGRLTQMLDEQIFCYANVPYRIKPYGDVVANSSEDDRLRSIYRAGNRSPRGDPRRRRQVGAR